MDEENDLNSFVNKIGEALLGEDWDQIRSNNMPNDPASRKSLSELFSLSQLEKSLDLPERFLEKLVAEDDWSFVIKLHALIEAALSYLLTETVGEPRLLEVFSRIELSNSQTGKLVLAKHLDLIDSDTRQFIRNVSEIRNQFVHNVANVNLSLNDFINQDSGRCKKFEKAFCWNIASDKVVSLRIGEDRFDPAVLLKLFAYSSFKVLPKISIWCGAIICIRDISRKVSSAKLNNEMRTEVEKFVLYITAQNQNEV